MTLIESSTQRATRDQRSFRRPRAARPLASQALRGLFYGCTCLLAATLPLESILGGYDPVTGAGLRSPSWYVGLLAAVLAIPFFLELARAAIFCRPLLALLGAFTTGLVVLWLRSLADIPGVEFEQSIDRPFKAILMATFFMAVAAERPWRKRLVGSFMLGWVTFVALALYMAATGQASSFQHFTDIRYTVLGMNANVMAVLAALGILLLLNLATTARNTAQLMLALLFALPGVVVFLFGSSRTAFAGLVAGAAVLGWLALRDKGQSWGYKAARIGLSSAVVIAAIAWLLSSSSLFSEMWGSMESRVGAAASGEDRGGRGDLALATIELALENPLGVGSGQATPYLGTDPHNSYLKIVVEGGIVAFVFLIGAAASLIPHIRRAVRTRENDGILAAFAMLATCALAGQALVESPFWLFFALAVSAERGAPPLEVDTFRLARTEPEQRSRVMPSRGSHTAPLRAPQRMR